MIFWNTKTFDVWNLYLRIIIIIYKQYENLFSSLILTLYIFSYFSKLDNKCKTTIAEKYPQKLFVNLFES